MRPMEEVHKVRTDQGVVADLDGRRQDSMPSAAAAKGVFAAADMTWLADAALATVLAAVMAVLLPDRRQAVCCRTGAAAAADSADHQTAGTRHVQWNHVPCRRFEHDRSGRGCWQMTEVAGLARVRYGSALSSGHPQRQCQPNQDGS